MKGLLKPLIIAFSLASACVTNAIPEQDKEAFQRYYTDRFPDITIADFANGVYALDQDATEQWESISDFPPYEDDLEEGKSYLTQRSPMVTITPVALTMVATIFVNITHGLMQNVRPSLH